MPTTPLLAPTNVNSVAEKDGSKVTVSWQDPNPNPAGTVASYTVSFVAKDTSAPAFPDQTSSTTSKDIPRKSGDTPTAADLASKYTAQVVAIAKDATKNTNSPPGVQGGTASTLKWEINPSITIKLGDLVLTLSKSTSGKSGGGGGRYSLPATPDNPYTISYDAIKTFAGSVGVGSLVPTSWPNGKPISGDLNVSKLAIDTDLGLFELDISIPSINFNPIPGLTIQSLGLNMLRTDGTTSL
jgi:hypothetical protein